METFGPFAHNNHSGDLDQLARRGAAIRWLDVKRVQYAVNHGRQDDSDHDDGPDATDHNER